jgi:hypothetical protein
MRPVHVAEDAAGKNQEYDQQDDPTADPTAASAKTETALQPIEKLIQQKEFEQTRETSRAVIAHGSLLEILNVQV